MSQMQFHPVMVLCRQKYYIVELTNMNITNNVHIHIPDTDKHDNLYTTTKSGSMTQEGLILLIKSLSNILMVHQLPCP